jgi:tetratricopeptide (TPR) repeat protein
MPLRDLFGKALAFFVLVAGCARVAAVARQVSRDADASAAALYQTATDAQRQGDYPRAIAAYQKLLELHPENAETRANLGMMYHLAGRYEEAIRTLEVAARAKPQLYGADLVLGMDLLHTGQHQRARPYLEKAHSLKPSAVEPVLLLAQADAALNECRAANTWYQRAIQIDDRNGEAWFGVGTTYLWLTGEMARELRRVAEGSYWGELLTAESLEERGAFRDAAEVYRKLSGEFPQQSGLHTGLGFCLALEGDPSLLVAATDELRTELKAHPGYLPARMGLARVALQQSKMEDLLTQLRAVWDADPAYARSQVSRLWIGLPPEKLNEFDQWLKGGEDSDLGGFLSQALEKWRQAPTAIAPETGAKNGKLSLAEPAKPAAAQVDPKRCYAGGHYSQCAAILEPRLNQLPPADLELLTECSYLRGDYRTSFQASQHMLQARPESAPALFWQARAASKLAFVALAKAEEIQPDSPQMHFTLGQSYMENQSYQEAAGEYRKALEIKPDYLAAHLGLSNAYFGAGQVDQALAEARAAVQQSPDDPVAACLLAELLMARRQYAEAAPYLDWASRSPRVDALRVHALRSRVLMAEGKTREALVEIKQALPSDIDGSYHYQLARIYRQLGDPKAAASALEQSERIRNANRDKRNPMPLPGGYESHQLDQ